MGIPHLRRFWSESLSGSPTKDWVRDNTLVCGLRLGLKETYDYLLQQRPTFEQFEAWILRTNGGPFDPDYIAKLNAALSGDSSAEAPADPHAEPALTEADLEFWNENGYVILHDAVPPEHCQAAADAIFEFLGVDPSSPETWYNDPEGHTIWVPLLHHPALQANRESKRIHRAFAQLWNREILWGTIDQAGFNPPEKPGWKFPGPHLHWDVSLEATVPFGVQGILYLTDTPAHQGAFTCVPGFHRRIAPWLASLPEGADPRAEDFSGLAIPIAGRAGDLVIWHQALPHGSSPNRGVRPRVVQYMFQRPGVWGYNPVWR